MSSNAIYQDKPGGQNRSIYLLGGISAIVVVCLIIIDIVFGSMSGGDLTALPQTAAGRFEQLNTNVFLGLYNLDFLNAVNQLLMIPVYIVLSIALKKTNYTFSLLALIIFLTGTILFVAGNTALTMLDLTHKYFSASEADKLLIASAGEGMLAKGSHGSFSVFFAFLLPNIAGSLMSCIMINSKVFTRLTGWLGLCGGLLMIAYIVIVTFIPSVQSLATAVAAPGGILSLTWIILFTIRFFKLSKE